MPRRGVEEWFWTIGDLQRISGEMSRTRPVLAAGKHWEPRIDLVEDDHGVFIRVELAGIRGDEIQLMLALDRPSLVVRGIRRDEDLPCGSGRKLHQLEIPTGEFSREILLPETPLDPSTMKAQFRNGILTIHIPKAERMVVTETITITGF